MKKNEYDEFRTNRLPDLLNEVLTPYIGKPKYGSKMAMDIFNSMMRSDYLYCTKCGVLYEKSNSLVRLLSEEGVKSLCDVCHSSGLIIDITPNMIDRINQISHAEGNSSHHKWKITEEQLQGIIFDERL